MLLVCIHATCRDCEEPTDLAFGEPMTGSAKQFGEEE
jgi:hypothetical protein